MGKSQETLARIQMFGKTLRCKQHVRSATTTIRFDVYMTTPIFKLSLEIDPLGYNLPIYLQTRIVRAVPL
jgi:hypothetical protein